MTTASGLSPVEAEQELSYPMEIAMLGLPHTTDVRSISKAGLSVVTITFEDDVDLYFARSQVQQRMLDAAPQLPAGAESMLGPPATAMGEVFQYLVESDSTASDTLTLTALTNIQEYTIKPLLRTVRGVADVNTWGGMPQQYQVNASPSRLAGYSLTLRDVENALANNNANFSGGYIEDRGERLTLRGLGRVVDTADIANVVIATRGSTPIHVRDVATVTVSSQLRYGAVTRDGKGEAISAVILMLKGANGRDVVDRVTQRLEEIRPLLPKGVHVRPFYNQGEVVERTTHTVFRNLFEGALLVIAILFLFLRNARASLLTASVIPLSLLVAFLAMKKFGLSANLMSLGALDFGLIVDASVVMVENFVRRLHETPTTSIADRRALLQRAAFEVGRPIVFGVAIIVAVYIPIFTLEGIEGRMFRPMAFTVCAAVLGSLLLALTYVPAVASFVFARRKETSLKESHEDSRWFLKLRAWYASALQWAFSHRIAVIGGALVVFAIAFGSMPFLGTEFMPRLDEGYLLIESRRIPSTSLAQGVAMSAEVERTLKRFPEIQGAVTNLGRPQSATETMALNQGDVYVLLSPKSKWRASSLDALIPQLDSALSQIPGLEYDFSAPMAMRLDEVVSGVKTQLGIKIFGDSLPLLQEKAQSILEA
ncbi:MAG: efflux RND transporter permease subunit, partial [Gemmatimonadaceae bacterium]